MECTVSTAVPSLQPAAQLHDTNFPFCWPAAPWRPGGFGSGPCTPHNPLFPSTIPGTASANGVVQRVALEIDGVATAASAVESH